MTSTNIGLYIAKFWSYICYIKEKSGKFSVSFEKDLHKNKMVSWKILDTYSRINEISSMIERITNSPSN